MSDDSHRINRDRRGPDAEPEETFTCDYCGEEYDDRERFRRHRDRETERRLKGHPIGEALLEANRQMRTDYR